MKKIGTILIILCLFVVSVVGNNPVFAVEGTAETLSQPPIGYNGTDAQYAILGSDQLVKNVEAAFMYETNSDTLIYAWNPDLKMDPASFVKIMTALVAIEQGTMSDVVTVKQSVLDTVSTGAVSSDLVENEVISLENLLYCMLVGSGNDAAAVIADHIAGSQAGFVELMNKRALELNCTGTQFANPHGLPDEQQYTTARDTAKILSAAIKNEKFAEIFGTVDYVVPKTNKSEERGLITGNHLMSTYEMEIYYDSRVTGGRTGTARDGSQCLAVSAEDHGMALICIVMGSQSSYNDDGYTVHSFGSFPETKALLDAGFTGYKTVQLVYEDQVLLQREVVNGANTVSLGATTSVSTVLPESVMLDQLSFRYTDVEATLEAPVKKGDMLCRLEIWHNSLCVAQTDLYAMNDVAPAGALVIAERQNSLAWWAVLLIVLLVIVLCAIVFFVIYNWRRIKFIVRKWKRHRHRRSMKKGH